MQVGRDGSGAELRRLEPQAEMLNVKDDDSPEHQLDSQTRAEGLRPLKQTNETFWSPETHKQGNVLTSPHPGLDLNLLLITTSGQDIQQASEQINQG